MKVLACLGNPGKKYSKNRHNAGFIAAEYIKTRYLFGDYKLKFNAKISSGKINNEDVILVLPQTFMNNSGESVKPVLNFYKCDIEDLIVLHDEIELEFGDIRSKKDGGHKGNNGLRSIIQHTGSANFHRVRIGVGRPDHPDYSVADYVLSNFTKNEFLEFDKLINKVFEIIEKIV